MRAAADIDTYYRSAAVRCRIRQYCGAGGEPTCVFVSALVGGDHATWDTAPRFPPDALDDVLAAGTDVSRSLWDTRALLVHLDIDYENPDARGEGLVRPAHVFFCLEPLFRAVRHELGRLGLPLVDLMTGCGYHFTGRVPIGAAVVERVATLAPDDLPVRRAAARAAWMPEVDVLRHRASIGLGMVMEHLAHCILRRASGASAIPVVVNGTEVGTGVVGREAASIDLSYAGDPLEDRQIRVAFSVYQEHRLRPDIYSNRLAAAVPPLATVPRRRRSLLWMLEHGRRLDHAMALAEHEEVELPDVTSGLSNLVQEYEGSALAAFHREFYGAAPHPAALWPATYDRLDLVGGSPDEFRWILDRVDPDTRVCLDTSHTTLGGNWDRFVDLAGDRLVHVHANDHRGQFDDHLPPGEGIVDWTRIGDDLRRVRYDGWIMLELRCPGDPLVEHFRAARARLTELLGR